MMKTIHIFLLMFGALCCTCSAGSDADAGSNRPALWLRQGKGAKTDLKEILKRTVAIRVGADMRLASNHSVRMIEPENVEHIVKILWEDCYGGDWIEADVDPSPGAIALELEFLDIEGHVVGRVPIYRICSESDVRARKNLMKDLVLPDEQFLRLNELLEEPAQDARQLIHVWRVGGKTVFEYRGARYSSPEQLKEHADLSKGVVVHLMRKPVRDDILRLYKNLQEQGFMTVPHSNGPRARGSVLPIERSGIDDGVRD